MMTIYCNVSNKYRKSKNHRILYIFLKKLGLSIVYTASLVMNIKKYSKKKLYNYARRKYKSKI